MLKKLSSNHLVMILAAAAVLYVLANYSSGKGTILSGMVNQNGGEQTSNVKLTQYPQGDAGCCPGVGGQNYGPSQPLGQNSSPGSASGVSTLSLIHI